ncbi:MAG: hypothetical protein P4L61_02470, partial [Candidatus Pacebacteria bacterium]|nr:hypothetical protein [Candidatus Paceibacterota bacterium]
MLLGSFEENNRKEHMSAIGTRLAYVVLAAAQPLLTSCDQSSPDNNTAVSNIKFTDPLVSGGIVVRPPDAAEPLEDAQKPSTEFSLIGVKLSFERGFESTTGIGGGGGYEYEGKIEIGNPHTTPFHFDSIEISFGDGAGKKSARFLDSLAGETVILTEKSVLTVYHYGDQTIAPAVKNDPEHTPSDQVLEGHHAMSFHMSMASSLMPTICGKSFTTMRAQVMSNGKPVTGSYRGILPPIMKIPDEYAAKEENLFELRMWP